MNPMWLRALILVCVFAAVVLAVESIVRASAARRAERKGITNRLARIEVGQTHGDRLNVRRAVSSIPAGLPPFLDRIARKLERRIQQAQIRIPVSLAFAGLVIAPAVVMLTLVMLMLAWWHIHLSFGRLFICSIMSVLIGAALPLMVLTAKANRVRKRMQDQFPIALDIFVRGLRAGHPVSAALELITVELADPIGSEFRVVVDEVSYGAHLRDALQNMAEQWDLDDIRMFVVSLAIQGETGGNLSEILENLSRVIRERQSILMTVRSLSSEGRMTALILTILPVFTFTMLFIANPSFFLDVANDPWFVPGFCALAVLYFIGFVSIRRMVDLKV